MKKHVELVSCCREIGKVGLGHEFFQLVSILSYNLTMKVTNYKRKRRSPVQLRLLFFHRYPLQIVPLELAKLCFHFESADQVKKND